VNIKFDRSRYMKNWWRARLCRGCKFLHVGREVDHNHCDRRPLDNIQRRMQVHGKREEWWTPCKPIKEGE